MLLVSSVKLSNPFAPAIPFTVAVTYTEYLFPTSNPLARLASIVVIYTQVVNELTVGVYARLAQFSVTRTIGVLSALDNAPVSALFVENVMS